MRLSIDSSVEFSVWNRNSGYLFKGSPEFERAIAWINDLSLYTLCEDLDDIRARART